MIIGYIIYGIIGWCMEVLWTGLASLLRRDFRLMGNTSIWMFFIYGLAVFLEPISDMMISAGAPVVVRGLVYTVCIFAAEYGTGTLLGAFNVCPWDYGGSRFAVRGVIRLDYAPVWFAVGLLFEIIHTII